MNWKEKAYTLEQEKKWDEAITVLLEAINAHPNEVDPYIFTIYFFMNLLLEEDYDDSKLNYYETLAAWCFQESYAKFHDNPEYLYFAGRFAGLCTWHFGTEDDLTTEMMHRSYKLEPSNLIYLQIFFWGVKRKNPIAPELLKYAQTVLDHKEQLEKELLNKGAAGIYIFEGFPEWCARILINAEELINAHA